jgi:phage gp36-like protein
MMGYWRGCDEMAVTSYIDIAALSTAVGGEAVLRELLNVAIDVDISTNETALAAVATANSMVDGYVRAKYDPADIFADPVLVSCATNIAVWELLKISRVELAGAEIRSKANDDSLRILRDVAKGAQRGGMDLTFEPEDRAESLASILVVTVGSDVTTTNPFAVVGAPGQTWWPRF